MIDVFKLGMAMRPEVLRALGVPAPNSPLGAATTALARAEASRVALAGMVAGTPRRSLVQVPVHVRLDRASCEAIGVAVAERLLAQGDQR